VEPVISVIIPTRNRLPTLQRTIAGYLEGRASVAWELVVVDDGSDDDSWGFLRGAMTAEPRLRAWRQEHAGPARARNLAISQARGRYLLLAGDDVRPAAPLVEGHAAAHESGRSARFVLGRTEWDPDRPITPVMRHVTGFGGQQFRYEYLHGGQRLGFKYFYGSNISFRRAELAPLGESPLDPAFEGAAFEDADVGYRLMGHRAEIEYHPELVAYHDHPYTVAAFAHRQYRVGLASAGGRHVQASMPAGTAELSGSGSPYGVIETGDAEGFLLQWLAALEPEGGRWFDRLCLSFFSYCYAKGVAESRSTSPLSRDVARASLALAMRCPLRVALRSTNCRIPDPIRSALEALARDLDRAPGVIRRPYDCIAWRLEMRAREAWHRVCQHRARRSLGGYEGPRGDAAE
jgi:glycosyltransferase involved in cell wall biosynthesis